ncbi:MAG TPA: hypothetical protein VLY21_06745 [Nitrososphaerales archaeon]|nr:hypothetical protein [Nitrososphaerales archaeon]
MAKRKKSVRTKRNVDVVPVLIVFLVALLTLGLGAAASLPIEYVLGAFVVVLAVAFVLLARSLITR